MAKKNVLDLNTFIPELPSILQNKFNSLNQFISTFYDEENEILVAPVRTSGNVRGARAEFATGVFENLVVRNQFTNLYENSTTGDLDFVNTYNGSVVETRNPDPSIFLMELSGYDYVDVNKPYYKIDNTKTYAFQTDTLAQEFQLILDVSISSTFDILIDPSNNSNGQTEISIPQADASTEQIKLICVDVDPSWGATWTVKQSAGKYTINQI